MLAELGLWRLPEAHCGNVLLPNDVGAAVLYEPLLFVLLWLLGGRTVYLALQLPQTAEKLNNFPAG